MPLYSQAKRRVFATCPRGQHQSVIADITYHIGVPKEYEGRKYTQDEYHIIYQMKKRIPDDFPDEQVRGKMFEVRERYSDKMEAISGRKTPKLVEHIAMGLLGRAWTDVERYGKTGSTDPNEGRFDFETLIGMNCILMISHRQFDNGVWAFVQGVGPYDGDDIIVPEPTIASLFAKDSTANNDIPAPSDDDLPF